MDMNFIKECEDFYTQIGIDSTKWDKFDNPHEYAIRFSNIYGEKNNTETHISTSDNVSMSEETVKGLVNA